MDLVTIGKLASYILIIVVLWSFSGNYILYLLFRNIFYYLIVISFTPLYLIMELVFKIRKKVYIGKTSYVSSGHLHMINNRNAIKCFEEAKSKGLFEIIVLFNCYLAIKRIGEAKLTWNTYTHIVSEATMKQICVAKVNVTANTLVEYAYINSSFGKFGLLGSLKKSKKIISYVKDKVRCEAEIDKNKLQNLVKDMYLELCETEKSDFEILCKRMFSITSDEIDQLHKNIA